VGAVLPVILTGCNERKTTKILKVVSKRLLRCIEVVNMAWEGYEMVMDIKAIVEGKDEKIQVRLTKEEMEQLDNGGELIIRDSEGKEHRVPYEKR
jgi:hypothetical protein